jgi:hypothetical protein
MNRVRFALAVAILAAASCATVTPEMQHVRVTNNPDVVRGCKFLGNTSPIRDTQWRSGSWDNDSVFREQIVKMGGNVGYITTQPQKPTEGIGYYGEVYLCDLPAAPVEK